jgi:tetratricopeptide (TPR) repeat protein
VKYKIFFLLFIFKILTVNDLAAQTLVAFEEAGDAALSRKDYNAALQYFAQALEKDPKQVAILWKYAETARQYNSYTIAEKYYQKVASSAESKKYPLTTYWIALMKKSTGDYAGAKMLFEEVATSSKITDDYISLARKEIKSCDWAIGVIKTPKDVTIEHLGKNVNTPYSEFGAVKRNDTLFYSSLRFENKEDSHNPPRLIAKVLTTTDTTSGKALKKFNAENMHTANTAFSPKSGKIFFCHCEYMESGDDIRCDLYMRSREGKDWGKAEKLSESINMPGTSTTQPAVGIDKQGQEILYFVSNRKDGKGKNDIWYASILSSGTITSPINLAMINTRGDEMTPFFHTPNNTLYFSSDGYETLGGLDMFSALKSGGTFDTPQNMGSPLNSSYNDFYFNILPEGNEAYFSSNRVGSLFLDKKNETCCYDVYRAKFPKEILKTPKKETPKPPVATTNVPQKTSTNVPPTTSVPTTKTTTSVPPKGNTPPTGTTVPPTKTVTNNPKNPKPNTPIEPEVTYTTLDELLPLPLYFDNDEPDNNTKATTTSKTYEQAFNIYYARKLTYMEKSSKSKQALEKMQLETEMMQFFEQTIKQNFVKLQKFTPILLSRLYKGEKIEIIVKGFASPLAKNDYNTFLGKRRVASLYNYWNTFENGIFKKYYDNGQLKITQVSYGEDTAAKDISDDQRNEAASIYNLNAAKERRIEIIEVKSSNAKL